MGEVALKSISLIFFLLFAFFASGCSTKRGLNAPGYKTINTNFSRGGNYSASLHISGDLSYLDRKYFTRAFASKLEGKGISLEYNSENRIDIRVTKTVLDTRTSGGDSYQNCSTFKLDRKVTGVVEYILRGKETYANSINYKFLVKSSSCLSYDDAERKARLKLIKRLGEITGSKVATLRGKFITSSQKGCNR